MQEKENKKIREDLSDIKTLLILIASKLDATSQEIGNCMNVDGSAVRHMLFGSKRRGRKK